MSRSKCEELNISSMRSILPSAKGGKHGAAESLGIETED